MLSLRDSIRVVRSITRVMLDSERTNEIHLVEELTSQGVLRRWLARHQGAELDDLLTNKLELSSKHLHFDELRALPPSTLGRSYIDHLDNNGLSADSQATPTTDVKDPDLAYLVRRFRQTHDVWHALLELGTAGHEEVTIHAFSWGQLRLPVSALVVSFGSLKHVVAERRWELLRRGLRDAYVSGLNAAPLLGVRWETRWSQPIASVRNEFGIRSLG